MDPAHAGRRTGALLGVAAVLLASSGCGDGADQSAEDPSASPSSTPSASPPAADFAPEDYSFTLEVTSYCPGAGTPIRVRVVDGEVAEAVYAEAGPRIEQGAPAPRSARLTIDEIIGLAADPDAASVDVDWPEGQDYPTSVYVDPVERAVDDEVGYRISDVDR